MTQTPAALTRRTLLAGLGGTILAPAMARSVRAGRAWALAGDGGQDAKAGARIVPPNPASRVRRVTGVDCFMANPDHFRRPVSSCEGIVSQGLPNPFF